MNEHIVSRRRALATAVGTFAAICLAPSLGLAQTVRRVAVVCEPGDDASRHEVSRFESRLGGALLKTGRYSLVDRERLDKLIKEQGFSNSAYADPATAAKLGKLAGAERFLNVKLTATVDSEHGALVATVAFHVSADFTLVDVSTGRISAEGSADGDAQDKAAAGGGDVSSMVLDRLRRQAIDSCIDDLLTQLTT